MIVPNLHRSIIPDNLLTHEFTLFVGHLPALPTASSQQVLPSVAIKVRLDKRKSKRTTESTEQITQKQAELKALNARQAEIETKISGNATDADAKAKMVNQLVEMQKARDKLRVDVSELLVSQADTETNKRPYAEIPTHEAPALRLTFPDKIQLDQLLPGKRKRAATLCLTVLEHLVKQSLIEQLTGHRRALDVLMPTSVATEMTKGGYPSGNSLYLITGTNPESHSTSLPPPMVTRNALQRAQRYRTSVRTGLW